MGRIAASIARTSFSVCWSRSWSAPAFEALAYGLNLDDRQDFRPGHKAAAQHRVAAPLAEAGLTKADVRALAQRAELRVWDKPASACLSSRMEYGRRVTPEALRMIEQAEDSLRGSGAQAIPGAPSWHHRAYRDCGGGDGRRPSGGENEGDGSRGSRRRLPLRLSGLRRLSFRVDERGAAHRGADRFSLRSDVGE